MKRSQVFYPQPYKHRHRANKQGLKTSRHLNNQSMKTKQLKSRVDEPSKQMQRYANNRAKGMNKKQSALKAGYAKSTASTAKTQIEQKPSFEKLLDKIGLTKELVCSAIVDDIKSKPGYRYQELGLGSKILGITSDKLDITSQGQVISGFQYIKPIKEATESLKSKDKPKDE